MDKIVIDGRLESKPTVSELDGRLVARLSLLSTAIEIPEWGPFLARTYRYEVVAHGEHALYCRNLAAGDDLHVEGCRRTAEAEHEQQDRTEILATKVRLSFWYYRDLERGESREEDEAEPDSEIG